MRKREIKVGQKVKISRGKDDGLASFVKLEKPFWGRLGTISKLDDEFDDLVWVNVPGLKDIVWHYKELQKR